MRWILLSVFSWITSFAGYLVLLRGIYGQTIAPSHLPSVLFWSWVAAIGALSLVMVPALVLLKKLLGGCRPPHLFPILGGLLGIVPTLLLIWAFGGTFRSLLSHE